MTGASKLTFISLLTDSTVEIGIGLKSYKSAKFLPIRLNRISR